VLHILVKWVFGAQVVITAYKQEAIGILLSRVDYESRVIYADSLLLIGSEIVLDMLEQTF